MSDHTHRPAPQSTTSPLAASAQVAQGTLLLDVREDDEWAAGHAPGALHVPLGTITAGQRPASVPDGADVVVVCRSGRRSSEAADRLAAAGVAVRNLEGGMQAWAAAGLPVRREDGTPGTVA